MQKTSTNFSYITMVGVLFLGWFLFVINLETRSIWYDEPSTYGAFGAGFQHYLEWASGNVHAPFYFTYILIWQAIVGTQHLTIMRISSVFPALLAVAMSYRIGVDWFRNQWIGIATAVFLATSGLFIHYATDFRMYPMLIFIVALNWWALWRLLTRRRGGFWLYTLTLALLAYTHYFAIFSVVPQIIIVLGFYRHRFKHVILAGVIALILFSPWLPTAIKQITIAQEQGGQTEVVGKTLGTEPTSYDSVLNLIERYTAGKPAFIVLMLFLSFQIWFVLDKTTRPWYFAAWMWYFIPLLIMFGVNPVVRVYALRYTLPIFTGLALLVGIAIAPIPHRALRIGLIGLLVTLNLLTIQDGSVFVSSEPPHRPLIQYVDARFQPGDRVWYNMEEGALGSSQDGVSIHMRYETDHVTLDDFIWDAPYDYEDRNAVPRVWQVRPYWFEAPDIALNELNNGRVITNTVTIDSYIINLYEAPPQNEAARFDDLFTVRSSVLNEPEINAGDEIQVNTWWNVIREPTHDYSYTLLLTTGVDPDTILLQQDEAISARPGILDIENMMTTQSWQPEQQDYFVPLLIDLPEHLQATTYSLWLGVYYWEDETALAVSQAGSYTQHPTRSMIELMSFEVD